MFVDGFVNLYTRDIEAAFLFYRDLLGFEETFRTPTIGTPEHVELTLKASTRDGASPFAETAPYTA